MDIRNLAYYANRTLLTFFGPAELDDHNDPRQRLKREHAERKRQEAVPAGAVAAAAAPAVETTAAPRVIA